MASLEKPVSWYNEVYGKVGWIKPSLESRHIYTIAELKRLRVKTILDIGCGQGGPLSFFRASGFTCYGFDFSYVAIEVARKVNRLENVWVGNALDKKNYDGEYDTYLAIQVLEHMNQDLDVIKNLKPSIPFIFSLPHQPKFGDGHVRDFPSDESISQRYGEIVDIKSIKLFDKRRVVVSMTKD